MVMICKWYFCNDVYALAVKEKKYVVISKIPSLRTIASVSICKIFSILLWMSPIIFSSIFHSLERKWKLAFLMKLESDDKPEWIRPTKVLGTLVDFVSAAAKQNNKASRIYIKM